MQHSLYGSKAEIYEYFPIAVKFVVKYMVPLDYEDIYNRLHKDHQNVISHIANGIKNIPFEYPLSVGVFVELPEMDSKGKPLGVRYILLQHETGPELFIAVLKGAASAAGKAIVAGLLAFMKTLWEKCSDQSVRFEYVEIRTKEKGVMRFPMREMFEERGFESGADLLIRGLRCLSKEFPRITNLTECNQKCFEGRLFMPPKDEGMRD